MQNVAISPPLLEDQRWFCPIIHEAGATINPMAELVEQIAQASGKATLDATGCWI